MYQRVRLLCVEDSDAVPVVDLIGLLRRAFSLYCETVGIDAVFVGEDVVYGLCATFREAHVVFAGTGVLVGVTYDGYILVGISLHPLCDVVDVDHFLVADTGRVESEAYGSHQGGRSLYDGNCFFDLGAGKLSLGGSEGSRCCGKGATEVIDLVVEIVDIAQVVTGIVALVITATEGNGETAGHGHVNVDRTTKGQVVEVVAIELCGAFGIENTRCEFTPPSELNISHMKSRLAVTYFILLMPPFE